MTATSLRGEQSKLFYLSAGLFPERPRKDCTQLCNYFSGFGLDSCWVFLKFLSQPGYKYLWFGGSDHDSRLLFTGCSPDLYTGSHHRYLQGSTVWGSSKLHAHREQSAKDRKEHLLRESWLTQIFKLKKYFRWPKLLGLALRAVGLPLPPVFHAPSSSPNWIQPLPMSEGP